MPNSKAQATTMPGQMAINGETVIRIPLNELHPYPDHPYAIREDRAMQDVADSIKVNGVVVPAIVRPRAAGGYEIVAGHRRKLASEQAGFTDMPCIVRNLTDDETIIQLVDSNAQREDVLPSERAKAYKMRLDAIKRQGQRTDLASPTSPNNSAKFRSDEITNPMFLAEIVDSVPTSANIRYYAEIVREKSLLLPRIRSPAYQNRSSIF